MKSGVIILVHGSRGERASAEFPQVLQKMARGLKPFLAPEVPVTVAALQFNHPDLQEATKGLVAQGVSLIVVVPYFLFPGRHVTEDIPQLVGTLESAHPETRFVVADSLGLDEHFIEVVARRIADAAPELLPRPGESAGSPETIERRSLEIIETLLPPLDISPDERAVIKRIVHTCGDPSIARSVRFSASAVAGGMAAIDRHSPVFTDVRMAATGINSRWLQSCGCSVLCALDAPGTQNSQDRATTRTAAAMYHLGTRLDNAIVVVGNAPTALLAVIDMIDRRLITPALVVGMPVGFVQAGESKDELMRRDIPYITIVGTRGGSAMAAATVNALLKVAVEKNTHERITGKAA